MTRKSHIPTEDEKRATLAYIARHPGKHGKDMSMEITYPIFVLERVEYIHYRAHTGWRITRLGQCVLDRAPISTS